MIARIGQQINDLTTDIFELKRKWITMVNNERKQKIRNFWTKSNKILNIMNEHEKKVIIMFIEFNLLQMNKKIYAKI